MRAWLHENGVGPPEGALPTIPAGRFGTLRAVATDVVQRGSGGGVSINAEWQGRPDALNHPNGPRRPLAATSVVAADLIQRPYVRVGFED